MTTGHCQLYIIRSPCTHLYSASHLRHGDGHMHAFGLEDRDRFTFVFAGAATMRPAFYRGLPLAIDRKYGQLISCLVALVADCMTNLCWPQITRA